MTKMSLQRRLALIAGAVIFAVLVALVARQPIGPEAAGAHKMCRNTHHHHYQTVDSVLREVHWIATVTQAGPNQLKYSWRKGLNAHNGGGSYVGYNLC